MRKVTQNLILSIAICVLSISLAVLPTLVLIGLDGGMDAIGEFFEEIWDNGEVDTVEGHGAILVGALGMLGLFGEIIIFMMLYLLGKIVAVCLILTIIARFLFAPQKGWRLTGYRILMTLLYVLQAGVAWFSFALVGIDGAWPKLTFLPIGVLIVAGTIWSAINTYSERILK